MMNGVRTSCITNAIALLGFCIVGGVAQAADPAYRAARVRKETAMWGAIIKDVGIRLE